jgi:hypothetical protein
MYDDSLNHLVRALDAAVESSPHDVSNNLHHDLEQVQLRLRCLTRRLGQVAEESPYVAFLRRTTRAPQTLHAQHSERIAAISA